MLQYWFLIFVMSVGDTSCKEKYIDFIISDFRRESYFLVLTVKDITEREEKVLIQNRDLYLYLRDKHHVKKEQYLRLLKEKLKLNEIIYLQDTLRWGKGFSKCMKNEEVEKNANRGKEYFFDKYFYEDGELKKEAENEINAIIGKLFEWNIPVKIDHESGNIFALKSFVCTN